MGKKQRSFSLNIQTQGSQSKHSSASRKSTEMTLTRQLLLIRDPVDGLFLLCPLKAS